MQNHARKIRESKGMTLEQVAEHLGRTKAQVSKMERGITRLNVEWLDEIAKLYKCSVHDLIDDDEPCRVVSEKSMGADSEKSDFTSATLLGKIDSKQVGFIEDVPLEMRYSLRFGSLGKTRSELIAFNLKGDLLGDYKDGAQLIFAKLNENNKRLLKDGSIVICTQKDKSGRECGSFLRVIEFDDYGFPYAVFKIKYGRNSFSKLSETLLAGKIGIEGMMEIYKEMDSASLSRKAAKKEIHLENNEIDIKAVLVKSIRDE